MTTLLQRSQQDIRARMRDLEPVVREHQALEEAYGAIAKATGVTEERPAPRRRRPGPSAKKRGRPRGSGRRGAEAAALVRKRPGITIPQLAEAMRIQPNYLYRVVPALEADGEVRRGPGPDGGKLSGWYPAEA